MGHTVVVADPVSRARTVGLRVPLSKRHIGGRDDIIQISRPECRAGFMDRGTQLRREVREYPGSGGVYVAERE